MHAQIEDLTLLPFCLFVPPCTSHLAHRFRELVVPCGCVTFEDRLPTMPTAPKKLPVKFSASPARAPVPLPAANFPAQLIQTRRRASMTQQALAGAAGVRANQMKRHEADRRIFRALLDGMIVKHQTKQMVGTLSS